MRQPKPRAAAMFALFCAPFAYAQTGSVESGATKVATCIACHGLNGNSTNPEWPKLAGQNASYTAEQLRLLRAGQRWSPVMSPQARMIANDADIPDIAAYFAAQAPAGLEADPSYWKNGEKLYRGGDRARNIPACIACHGPVGRGNPGAGYPALRAQHAVYVVKALNDYAINARSRDDKGNVGKARNNNNMMMVIAKRMTPEDMRNVASYVQGMR